MKSRKKETAGNLKTVYSGVKVSKDIITKDVLKADELVEKSIKILNPSAKMATKMTFLLGKTNDLSKLNFSAVQKKIEPLIQFGNELKKVTNNLKDAGKYLRHARNKLTKS